jgi:hypothetical protein
MMDSGVMVIAPNMSRREPKTKEGWLRRPESRHCRDRQSFVDWTGRAEYQGMKKGFVEA